MVRKIKYGGFFSVHDSSIYMTNDAGQTWKLVRQSVSEEKVKKLVKELGKNGAINRLVDEKHLIPVYGGELSI